MIETAIYSWRGINHEAMPWSRIVLWLGSVSWARKWFANVILFADESGRKLLSDQIGLPFTDVRPLPVLPDNLAHIYDLPKMSASLAMAKQGIPALHIDFDAFKRKPFKSEHLEAETICEFTYTLKDFLININRQLPFPRFAVAPMQACACGIFGGNDSEAIARVCETSLEVALNPKNRDALASMDGYQASVMFGEAAFGDAFSDTVKWLLPGADKDRRGYHSEGYIHMAGMKLDRGAMAQAEIIVMNDWPEEYREARKRFDAIP